MNLYLLNSDEQYWQSVDKNLKSINALFPQLRVMAGRIAGIDTRIIDEGQRQFATFEKAMHDTFSTNQSFIKARGLMVVTGGKVGPLSTEYLMLVQKRLQEAVNMMDVASIQSIFEQFAVASSLVNGLADLRVRILRSLAERNNIYMLRTIYLKFSPKYLLILKTLKNTLSLSLFKFFNH